MSAKKAWLWLVTAIGFGMFFYQILVIIAKVSIYWYFGHVVKG